MKRLSKKRKRGEGAVGEKGKKEKPDSADRLRTASFGRGDYRDRDVSDAGRCERV
ncbi:MAG: hypothetical protein ACLUXK_06840 [[Ruminococcus] torques]